MSAGKIGTESGAKLRLLCLHGYRQDALTFRSKIGSLRKAMKNRADFIFIDGPYPIKETENGETEVVGRAWWNWSEAAEGQSNGSGSTSAGKTTAAHYLGWSESFDAIGSALEEHWPIDGILGFSQGMCVHQFGLLNFENDLKMLPSPSSSSSCTKYLYKAVVSSLSFIAYRSDSSSNLFGTDLSHTSS